MVCKPDGKKVLEKEEFYTTKCEACNCFVKIDKYRSCEERHKWNSDRGVDVFEELREVDRAALQQMGVGGVPTQSSSKGKERKSLSRHRGRR